MITEFEIRNKFEKWANELGHSLVRHPSNEDFYYAREVSSLWVCFLTAYNLAIKDASESFQDLLDLEWEAADEEQQISPHAALIQFHSELDE